MDGMGWKGEPFPGLALELTGVAPTILRHEGRLPLPPLLMQGDVLEGRTISGAHCPDVLLNFSFRTAAPGYTSAVFPAGRA